MRTRKNTLISTLSPLTEQELLAQGEACLENPDKLKEALTIFKILLSRVIEADEESLEKKADYTLKIGFCYSKLSDHATALRWLKNKEVLDNPLILENIILCYIQLNNVAKARQYIKKLIKLRAHNNLANSYFYFLHEMRIENKYIPDGYIASAESHKIILKYVLKHADIEFHEDAKICYYKFQINCFLAEKNYEQAYLSALKIAKSSKPVNKLFAYNLGGYCQLELNNNMKLAVQFYEKFILTFKASFPEFFDTDSPKPQAIDNKDIEQYASVLHQLAKVYDGSKDESLLNLKKQRDYLIESASFGFALSHHDLAVIYESEENSDNALNLAITHYTQAAQLHHDPSLLNLSAALIKRNDDDDKEKALDYLKHAADSTLDIIRIQAYLDLGLYYVNYVQLMELDNSLVYQKLAFDYYMLSQNEQDTRGTIVIANMYKLGFGVERNSFKALDYFLLSESQGLEVDLFDLRECYVDCLNDENDSDARAKLIQTISQRFGDAYLKGLTIFDQLRRTQSKQINQKIINVANDRSQHLVKRIDNLLNYNIQQINTVNLCTLLHRLGDLTDKSLDYIDFHQKNLPRIIPLLERAHRSMLDSRLSIDNYVNLVASVSKLYLAPEIGIYKNLIELFYQKAYTDIQNLSPASISILLIAATRLNPQFDIAITLNAFVDKILAAKIKDERTLIQSIYSITVLSMQSTFKLPARNYLPLINTINKALTKPLHYSSKMQICQALYNFNQDSSYSNVINKAALDLCAKSLMRNETVTISSLQNTITQHLALFFEKIHREFRIEIYSVDALVTVDKNKKFILQVDGPSHFLHSNNTVTPNNRTLFRDEYLSRHYPVVNITYKEWNEVQNNFDKIRKLFEDRLRGINVILPAVRTDLPKNYIHRFFNNNRSPSNQAVINSNQITQPMLGMRQ